jgi:hypothetical protein
MRADGDSLGQTTQVSPKGKKMDMSAQMIPGQYVWDMWTQIWVKVVYGAQPAGYTTIQYKSGNIVAVRTDHLEA